MRRRYRGDTLILETEIETQERRGAPDRFHAAARREPGHRPHRRRLARQSVDADGTDHPLRLRAHRAVGAAAKRFDGLEAIAGPDALILRTPIETHGEDLTTVAEFTVAKGDRVPFVLTWFASHKIRRERSIPSTHCATRKYFGRDWAKQFQSKGKWRDAVVRSLITLKGLTYAPTGGLVAAPTTSLPEQIGGVRNWDYRYCWLRDATLILLALLRAGYREEAKSWREWLLRAIAGSPAQMQMIYGVSGERRLD